MPYILGIDQGGTKVHAAIADHNGRILGFGDDSDWEYVENIDRRIRKMLRIRHATDKALAEAGLTLNDIERVSGSCTGADWPFEYPIGLRHLRETLGVHQTSIYNDCIGALRGGTETNGHDCAVICLGTGANCAVQNREGEMLVYSYYLKDIYQGAGAIGRFIVQAVVDASVGFGSETELTKLLLNATGFATVEEFYTLCTTGRTEQEAPLEPVYKDLCPLLFEAIKLGDQVACEYINDYCRALAQYVIIAARKLSMADREITVVISGGVVKGGAIIVELIERYLRMKLPRVRCVDANLEPIVGALLLEYDKIYPKGVPSLVMRELERHCEQRGLFRSVRSGVNA